MNLIGLHSYNLLLITIFTLPAILFYNISAVRKIIYSIVISSFIFILFIYGSQEINKNTQRLKSVNEKIFVKIISPNFDLKYGLTKEHIEERFKKLIRYSDPDKDKKTLFIWPEGVFSGYSYDEVLAFKQIILKNFSKKHFIIFGTNKLEPKTNSFYNSMLIVDNKSNNTKLQ